MLLAPIILLPEQLPPRIAPSGLRALLVAVLESALRDAEAPQQQGNWVRYRAEARDWLRSSRDDWPFSFLALCETLGMDAGAVRRAAMRRWAPDGMAQRRLRSRMGERRETHPRVARGR